MLGWMEMMGVKVTLEEGEKAEGDGHGQGMHGVVVQCQDDAQGVHGVAVDVGMEEVPVHVQ